ncbi:transcriptional regulator [Azorhizobium oxalatiphilum]|uniref:Transcriptional regulator n=1 Tax=Azorhizobium oxalatiphilum TaxID=980631 RepID=A0A917CBU7_9HYPH|nr:winged helix-turn-helix domain-containing protein [Azorhizobium oxalatiphilum]GGF77537.1 transcriptional regulator [Azorhizobium oxalatiphilum]
MNHRSDQDTFRGAGARPAMVAGFGGARPAGSGSLAGPFTFGDIRADPATRSVTRAGAPVRIGSRARDILFVLLETPGTLVTHQALMARIWPDMAVEESALRVHVAALRKALGDSPELRLIVNETGRGYRFAAPVAGIAAEPAAVLAPSLLPAPLCNLIGRGGLVDGLLAEVKRHRLLTISGPGGIGKTRVGLAVAHAYAVETGHAACFVDLAPVTNGALVASTVAARLGLAAVAEQASVALTSALAGPPVLLLLDNCEHVVDAVAELAETLLRGAPAVRLLLTSREPLRVDGEWVHRLTALGVPGPEHRLSVAHAAQAPAVQLFVERARAVQQTFALTEANVAAVCDICVRLDGLPLALEFAAARLDVMDVAMLAGRLDDRFAVLTQGKRTALPRQQTLRAVLDWSYELLDAPSQMALRRLAVFTGSFDLRAALAVAVGPDLTEAAAFDALTDLVGKSLLVLEGGAGRSEYRFLDTTRHYALRHLAGTPEESAARRRHARHFCALFSDAHGVWEGRATREWIAACSRRIDDIRAAFDWAFSAEGDNAVRVQLLSTAAFIWFDLSLPSEFMQLAERALNRADLAAFTGSAEHVGLLTAYGHALWHVRGAGPEMASAFATAQEMAARLGQATLQRRALWGIWAQRLLSGDYAASLEAAKAYEALSPEGGAEAGDPPGDPPGHASGRRMYAISRHFLGQHGECRAVVEGLMGTDRTFSRPNYATASQVDARISALAFRMRTLWIEGHVDEALELAHGCATYGSVRHDLSTCYCYVVGALPVALWSGDTNLAQLLLPGLMDRAARRGLRYWQLWGEGFAEALGQRAGPPEAADMVQLEVFVTVGSQAALARLEAAGRLDVTSWAQPELLRRRAVRRLACEPEAAERDLTRALALAQAHGARSFALRAATSLAALKGAQGAAADGARLLRAVRDALPGRGGSDVVMADRLLAELAPVPVSLRRASA